MVTGHLFAFSINSTELEVCGSFNVDGRKSFEKLAIS